MTTKKDNGDLSPEDSKKIIEGIGDITTTSPKYIADRIEAAKQKDKKAAMEIIMEAQGAFEEGALLAKPYMKYLAECFQGIINGDSADDALNIENPAHRPSDLNKESRDRDIVLKVAKERKKRGKRGEAIDTVVKQKEVTLGKKAVEKIYDDRDKIGDIVVSGVWGIERVAYPVD